MPKRIDLTGRRFGELEAIRLSDARDKSGVHIRAYIGIKGKQITLGYFDKPYLDTEEREERND